MPINTMDILKKHLESNMGDLGITIFKKAISNLGIGTNPTKQEYNTLIRSIEKTVTKLYGTAKSSYIFNNLRNELIEHDIIFDTTFSYIFDETLDNIFKNKGVPGESDICDMTRSIISSGCECDEERLASIIKRLVKKRIIRDIRDDSINEEIRSFIDKNPLYSKSDIEFFRNEIKNKKLEITDTDLEDLFEKERLFRKFNYTDMKESEDEKMIRQYAEMFDPKMKKEYEYLLTDAKLISHMKRNRYLHVYFKRPVVSLRLRTSYQ